VTSYLEWWQDVVLPGAISEGSEITYLGLLRLYVIPSLGKIRLTKRTPGHVTEMLRSMEPRGLSPATCNAAKKVIGRALRRAMQEDLIYRKAAYIADGIRVKRKDRQSMTRFGNFPVAG
jgi:hypothetical protein